MARIIAIETTSTVCGICLIENKSIICEYSLDGGNIHDQMLADLIRKILNENSITDFKSIDAVAVSAGPGSFTGIRIGASVAKGLCFGNEPKFIAVPTLKSLARAFINKNKSVKFNNIYPVLDSVNNTAFFAEFNKDLEQITEIELADINTIKNKIDNNSVLCGNINPALFDLSNYHKMDLSPKHTALLGYDMYENGLFTNPEDFKPFYAQEFIPKIKLKIIKA